MNNKIEGKNAQESTEKSKMFRILIYKDLFYSATIIAKLCLIFEIMSKLTANLNPISVIFFFRFSFVCDMRGINIGTELRSIVFTSGKMRLLTTSLMKSDFVGILFVGGHYKICNLLILRNKIICKCI